VASPSSPDPIVGKIYDLIKLTTQVIRQGEDLMANQADLMAKIADLQAGQTELLKDARRLIDAGDTSGAIAKLDEVIASNQQLDTEIETAAPEATEPPATPETPTDEGLNLSGK
jgi:hypothetical protein